MKTILFIDGRNFIGKITSILAPDTDKGRQVDFSRFDFNGLLATIACQGQLKTAIIASSDSDLQPAVRELHNQNVERVYLGFEIQPNKGLTSTTNRTILIRNSEVKKSYRVKK